MPTLRHLATASAIEIEHCQLVRTHEVGGISLCSFFVPMSHRVVLGERYSLHLEGEALLVVPIESIQREPGWTQILAAIVGQP